MKVGPKYKICKRLGSGVFEKCQTQKFMLAEERRGKSRLRGKRRRVRTLSDYGRQLLEKQKVRFTYGISERQLARYVRESVRAHENPTAALFVQLERRLDNVVYRLGLANTRRFARQIVSHGHIMVNGKKMTIPSHKISSEDVISVREGSRVKIPFTNLIDRLAEHMPPGWLTFDVKKIEGKIVRLPELTDAELQFDLRAVFEFYSR